MAPGSVYRLFDRSRRGGEIPVVVCVDVEPDPRTFDPGDPPPWRGLDRFIERIPALRQQLETATGAPAAFTWLLRMDPQVEQTWGSAAWLGEEYGDALSELVADGDELGLHTHVWRQAPDRREWISDFADLAWGEHCVVTGLDAFEQAFGRPCRAHRGGDRHLTGAMLSLLAARGVKIDLTVEPGLAPLRMREGESARGTCPDYRRVPVEPYRSSSDRFPAPDPASRADPLVVPVMSAPRRRPPFRRHPLHAASPSGVFAPRLAAELARRRPSVLPLAVRSSDAMGSDFENLSKNLDHLARHERMPFVTASAALKRLDGR